MYVKSLVNKWSISLLSVGLQELLDKAGGFAAFGVYLAEDFFFAKTVQVIMSELVWSRYELIIYNYFAGKL